MFREWRDNIAGLQDRPNVYFKLGGINMKINGFGWHKREQPPTSDELVEKTAAYYEHCIDTFGASRCMFESNFPVDRESVSYPILWNAFKKIAANRTAVERQSLFHGTAAEAYRLTPLARQCARACQVGRSDGQWRSSSGAADHR